MLLSGIIPLLILGFLSYASSSQALKKRVSETNMLLLEQTRMRFEQTLDIIYSHYVLLGNDPSLTDQLNRSLSYSDVTIIPEIQKKLHEIQNLQNLVRGSRLVNLQNDWVIYHDYFQDHVEEELRDYVNRRMTGRYNVFWTFEEDRDNRISLFIKLPYNSSSSTGALIVDLDQKEIGDYFLDDGDKKMLLADEEGSIVHYYESSLIGTGLESVLGPDYGERLTGDRGAFTFRDGGGTSQYVIYEKSRYNGWTYFILYDIRSLNRDIINIRRLTFLMIGIIILFLSVISVFWSSKRLYGPVGSIYARVKEKMLLEKEPGVVDEISYIGRGVDSLFEERQRLKIEIARQTILIEELFMRKLIRGELNRERIGERTESLGKFRDFAGYYLVCFRVSDSGDEEMTAVLLLSAIRAVLEKGGQYLTPILKNGIVVALIDSTEGDVVNFRENLFVELLRLQADIGMDQNMGVSMGISGYHRDPLETEIAYREGIEALMGGGEAGNSLSIQFYEDLELDKTINIVYPGGQEEELLRWIGNGNGEKAVQAMEGILDHIFGIRVGYREHMLNVSRLLVKLTNVLQDAGIPLKELFPLTENPMDQVMALTDREEIKAWFRSRLIEPIIPLLRKQRSSRSKNLIQDVIRMIEENYDQDLSLEECAYRLDYHPSYIWRIMKQEMGMGFSEYLLDFRLSQARKLLTDTDLSIGEIAEKLCYNNTQNFIRYFKKKEGVTPGAYRKENQIQGPPGSGRNRG